MNAVLTIARLTWIEARRRRIALAALVCGAAFLLVFAAAMFMFQQNLASSPPGPLLLKQMKLQMMTLAGLFAVNFLTVAMAVLLPIDTLSGEIASGVMQTVAAKPVRRWQIVLGKWVAYWTMVTFYLIALAGGVVLIMAATTGFSQPRFAGALSLMALEASVLLTLVIACGARFSTVTSGIVTFGFYGLAFIGGWIEQIGSMLGSASARYIGIVVSLLSPADSLWRLASYRLQPPGMRDLQITPFSIVSVPSFAMVIWSCGFIVLMFFLALQAFQRRAL